MNDGEKISCPLCNDPVDKLVYRYHIDSERSVLEKIKKDHPAWVEQYGVCSRCVDFYHTEVVMEQRMLPAAGPYFPIKSIDDFVILPTGLRIDAHPGFTGKGVTICFIDSGFNPHPDLTLHKNRIKKYVDVTQETDSQALSPTAKESDWHGTMTTVVCAGDGYLSNGLYKGIASEAELVLIKVQGADGHISTENIVKALQWVKKNHAHYAIRIVNISLGDDTVGSYTSSAVDIVAEELIAEGVIVIAAAGNDVLGKIHPPANSLNVIAVGGINDDNVLQNEFVKAYHSSYGITVDGLVKPELVAHAMWIAAPILPGSQAQAEAVALHNILSSTDDNLPATLTHHIAKTQLHPLLPSSKSVAFVRNAILQRIQGCKYISAHYMHVDGTSFAAPIITAVVAQMLQANPVLTPAMVRSILFSSCTRLTSIEAIRQGYGMIHPRKALLKIIKRETFMKPNLSPYISLENRTVEFYMHHDSAEQISLSGSFNNWAKDVLLMQPSKGGLWFIEIPLPKPGKYEYKFFIDSKTWVEDVDNAYRQPDGFNGFNSVLIIKS